MRIEIGYPPTGVSGNPKVDEADSHAFLYMMEQINTIPQHFKTQPTSVVAETLEDPKQASECSLQEDSMLLLQSSAMLLFDYLTLSHISTTQTINGNMLKHGQQAHVNDENVTPQVNHVSVMPLSSHQVAINDHLEIQQDVNMYMSATLSAAIKAIDYPKQSLYEVLMQSTQSAPVETVIDTLTPRKPSTLTTQLQVPQSIDKAVNEHVVIDPSVSLEMQSDANVVKLTKPLMLQDTAAKWAVLQRIEGETLDESQPSQTTIQPFQTLDQGKLMVAKGIQEMHVQAQSVDSELLKSVVTKMIENQEPKLVLKLVPEGLGEIILELSPNQKEVKVYLNLVDKHVEESILRQVTQFTEVASGIDVSLHTAYQQHSHKQQRMFAMKHQAMTDIKQDAITNQVHVQLQSNHILNRYA